MFSSDTLKKKKTASKLLEEAVEKKIDILVGTQLLSKGFHFPKLNCIVVVDGDFSSHGYDLRSAEKNVQLYHQLSGRAQASICCIDPLSATTICVESKHSTRVGG